MMFSVNGEDCENAEEFLEKAKEGFKSIGPVQKVEEGGHEVIFGEEDYSE